MTKLIKMKVNKKFSLFMVLWLVSYSSIIAQVCTNICPVGLTSKKYYVSGVTDATSCNWTVNNGAVITSYTGSYNDTAIIDFTAATGTVVVSAAPLNSCGTLSPVVFNIVINPDCDGDGNPNNTDPHPTVPTAIDDLSAANADIPKTINILGNDDFLPGVNTSITRTGGTAVGTVTFDPLTGSMVYTPTIEESGKTVTVVYQVCNTAIVPNVCATAVVNIAVADEDTDGDGVLNSKEIADGTSPKDPCKFIAASITVVATSTGDCDGDGVTNKDEINGPDGNPLTADGTDLNDPCSYNAAQITLPVVSRPCNTTYPDVSITNVNESVSGNVATNDRVLSGTTYGSAIPVFGNPSGALPVMNPNGSYTFTASVPGVYTFSIPVCAPGQTTNCPTETLTINVLNPAVTTNKPIANTDIATTKGTNSVTMLTLSNDLSGNVGIPLDISSVTIATQPKKGKAVVNPLNGNITYTPDSGFIGKDTLFYNLCDKATPNANCTKGMQIIEVLPITSANSTLAVDDYNSGSGALSGNLLINDVDPEKNTQSVKPQNATILGKGQIVINSNGTYTFIPLSGFTGPLDIVYEICDNGTPIIACAKGTLHLLITPPTVLQRTTDDRTPVSLGSTVLRNTGQIADITITDPKSGKANVDANGIVTYTPSIGFIGNDTVIRTVCTYDSLTKSTSCNIEILIFIVVKSDCTVPNYISPNDDGKNDVFNLDCILNTYPSARLIIYNRWGNVVWRSTGPYGRSTSGDNVWYGQHLGGFDPVADGVYYYLIELESEFGKTLTGFVEVMRK